MAWKGNWALQHGGGLSSYYLRRTSDLTVIAQRWLFFVEGTLTVLVAIAAIFILPDFPESACSWLSPEERALAVRRMVEDTGVISGSAETDTKGRRQTGFFMAIRDWKVWWLAATLTSLVASLSFNAYFPTLMSTIGYSPTLTLLLCTPPWIFATLVAIALSRLDTHSLSKVMNCSSKLRTIDTRIVHQNGSGI